jgi:hypothetical protein
MVKQELLDAYERLDTKRKLYEKATRLGNSFIAIGALILFSSIVPIMPMIHAQLLFKLFGIIIDLLPLWLGSILFGFILIIIGTKLNKRTHIPTRLSSEEEAFLKVVESLKDLDTYCKQKIEFSKVEAVKKLSNVERMIYEPSAGSRSLWQALSEDRNQDLRLLKQNLRERLPPTINQGGMEGIEKAYPVIEKFAEYLRNPEPLSLKDINETMSKLPPYAKKKAQLIPFFERHPKLRYAGIEFIFGLVSLVAYYIGTHVINISPENVYPLACTIWVSLTVGYWAIGKKKS